MFLFMMRLYLLILRCLRTKCCLAVVSITCVFILGRVFQYRRSILFRSVFHRGDDPFRRNPLDQYLSSNLSSGSRRFVPGQFLKSVAPQNASFCNFGYSLPESLDIPERDVQFSPELGSKSDYRVVYNVLRASGNGSTNKNNVTYSTHATPEFFYYLVEILYRWEGPVSVATFVPNTDASLIICLAQRLCRCVPDMSRVSLHFVFPYNYPPEIVPCPAELVSPSGCTPPEALLNGHLDTFRSLRALTYPINVARNVARIKAETAFILVSDVELFPSKNLVSNFMKMLNSLKKKSGVDYNVLTTNRLVYVLPVFEVQPEEKVPRVKSKLIELYSQNRAYYFHRWVCNHCQRFPGLQRWVLRKKLALDDSVEPFFVVRREFPFHRWEPVFIGTNSEPLYSELLTWEGQQDKMTQMHEMCLLHYRFIILDGGFLVHAPGVKRKTDIVPDNWRIQQQKRENSLHYDTIIQRITSRQKHNYRCKVH